MSLQILGVSGSPVRNSNTDRLVQRVIEASGLDGEFIKLRNAKRWSRKGLGEVALRKDSLPSTSQND